MKRSLILRLILASALILVSGCSLFKGSKKKDGSDNDLSGTSLNAGGNIPGAEGEGMFRDVHFAYDSSQLDDEARQDLEYNSQILRDNGSMKIQLEGHCDERGTEEYNMGLGQRRASSVKNYLLGLGIPSSRLGTVSYGANVPLVPGHDQDAWAKNRRVHFGQSGSLRSDASMGGSNLSDQYSSNGYGNSNTIGNERY